MKDFFKYVFAAIIGCFVVLIISMLVVGSIIAISMNNNEITPSTKPSSFYELELTGNLLDRSDDDGIANAINGITGKQDESDLGLDDVLKNIEKAKNDSNIVGIYLKASMLNARFASVKEIRDALVDFKKSGKVIISYADAYSQKMYYLCSVADKVLLNKQGILEFKGLNAEVMFLKKTLEKIGVEMQVVRVGAFKSAVEPYTNTQMSDSNKVQVNTYLRSLWNIALNEISKSRKVSMDDLNSYADEMLTFQDPKKYTEYKLIDKLVYEDEVDSVLKSYIVASKRSDMHIIKHNTLSKVEPKKKNAAKESIAIIYALGAIDYGTEEGIRSDEIIKTIEEVAKDESVKSVVLRVNSPGGSAFGSEKIWRALSLLKKKKPLVVSMGDVAASGGYYISCIGNKIVAQPNTITGSIGIFGLIPNLKGLEEKIGLSFDGVKTNNLSDAISVNRPMTSEEKDLMQAYVNRGYELFVKRCADGRHTTTDKIKEIAEGRVWSGNDALRRNLIDKIGGISEAVKIAAGLSKCKEYNVEEYPLKKTFIEKFMKNVSEDAESKFVKARLGSEHYAFFKRIKDVEKTNGIQAIMPFDIVVK